MASGDRRLGFSVRRGMTVLGKIPAVPKPMNLPSQRLENRGLDPSVEIVPRGTFGWGSGRSPPTTSSSWGSASLSSSPPVSSGAWGSAATLSFAPSSGNSPGVEIQPRPMSAGNTRPLSAGASRPLSASIPTGRAWGGTTKLEEQGQPSRFNLTNTDFPTLGSEKDLNWRPRQNTATSNRPTSADATKERHVAYTNLYKSVDRPTSADATKERKPLYTGSSESSHVDWPISADGSHTDKGKQQQALRLPSRPPLADETVPDQRRPFYTDLGPGTFDQQRENVNGYPIPVQQAITSQGKESMFLGSSQHDVYFKRPGGPHGNEVVVLPMDAGPEVYGSYAFNSMPNQSDMFVGHHPQATWGSYPLDKSGNPQVLHEPAGGNKREGFGIEQKAGWAGPNVVYISTLVDSRQCPIPLTAGSQKFPRQEMFVSPWGHQPIQTDWSNVHVGGSTVGMHQEMTSVLHEHAPPVEAMRKGSLVEVVTEIVKSSEKQTTDTDEAAHSSASQGQQATGSTNVHTHGRRKDVQESKQNEMLRTSTATRSTTVPDVSRNENHGQAARGSLLGTRPIKTIQEDNAPKVEQNKESAQTNAMPNMAFQSQQISTDDFQGFHQDRSIAKEGKNALPKDANGISKRKHFILQRPHKVMEERDLLAPAEEKKISLLSASNENLGSCSVLSNAEGKRSSLLPASDGNSEGCNILSSANILTNSGKESDEGHMKDARTFVSSKNSESSPLKSSTKELKTSSASISVVVSEDKAPPNDGSKTKRNAQSVRRAHSSLTHEPHLVDRQHGNHGMVWTPKPTIGDVTKDEVQFPTEDAGDLHETLLAERGKREKELLQEHEGQGEIRVQQMQSAAISQQGLAQQGQELSVGSTKRSSQQVLHHKAERTSKKQGKKIQQRVRDEQVMPHMSKEESLQNKNQDTVPGSPMEFIPPQCQANQREAPSKQNAEDAEHMSGGIISTVFTKSEGKKRSDVYTPKTARKHRQQHEQAYEAVDNHRGQHFYPKKPATEDTDELVCEAAIVSAIEVKMGCEEVNSRSSSNAKHHKGNLPKFKANLASEGHLLSGDRSQGEAEGKVCGPFLPPEVKGVKDKEERTRNQKHLRQQEMPMKQSATGSHQGHRYVGEDLKADTLSCESSTGKAEKKYVPKQAMKQYLPQELEATGSHGPSKQREMTQESTDKGQHDNPRPQPSNTHTLAKKRDMLRYTPLPARKKCIEGQQCTGESQHVQQTADLNEVHALGASSSHAVTEFGRVTESVGKGDDLQPCAMEHRDGRKVCEPFESVQSKKDAKQYVAKSSGKQHQSSHNFHEEASTKEEKWQRSNRVLASDPAKRKEGLKSYSAKHGHAEQEGSSIKSEGKIAKDTVVPPMPKRDDLVGNEKQENTEVSDCFHKDQNHLMKAIELTSSNSPSSKYRNKPQTEVEDTIQPSRAEEMHDSSKDREQMESVNFSGKNGSRQDSIEARDKSSYDDVEAAKPRQNQRRRYQYQPVAQHLQTGKPQVDASNTHRTNNRQTEPGYNRYERSEGPRRGQGQGYYYRATEQTDSRDSSKVW